MHFIANDPNRASLLRGRLQTGQLEPAHWESSAEKKGFVFEPNGLRWGARSDDCAAIGGAGKLPFPLYLKERGTPQR